MKRIIAFVLSLALLLAAVPATAEFDLNTFTGNPGLFEVDVDSDNNVAFVETKLTAKDLAFTHPYENDQYYSTIENDILVMNYFSSSRSFVLRTWIYYYGTKNLYFHSVSFLINGKKYTVSDVSRSERISTAAGDCSEHLLIRYGSKNAELLAALMATASVYSFQKYDKDRDESQPLAVPEGKLILHGTEDVEVDIPESFWIDMGLFSISLMGMDCLGDIGANDGNPCKVTELATE